MIMKKNKHVQMEYKHNMIVNYKMYKEHVRKCVVIILNKQKENYKLLKIYLIILVKKINVLLFVKVKVKKFVEMMNNVLVLFLFSVIVNVNLKFKKDNFIIKEFLFRQVN